MLSIIYWVVECLTSRKKTFDFGADSDQDPDTRIFTGILPLRDRNIVRID